MFSSDQSFILFRKECTAREDVFRRSIVTGNNEVDRIFSRTEKLKIKSKGVHDRVTTIFSLSVKVVPIFQHCRVNPFVEDNWRMPRTICKNICC